VTISKQNAEAKRLRSWCRNCRQETNHTLRESVEIQGTDEGDVSYSTAYQVVQCLGCETLAFRSVSTNSEELDSETGQPYESIEIYPNYGHGRPALGDTHFLPKQLEKIYQETLDALNRNQPILCGIGVRAVIETVVQDRKAAGRNLSQQINALVKAGILTTEGAQILHKLRVLGNKAAHEVKAHRSEELALAMDVVEHLLKDVYILPEKTKKAFR